jgi:phloretin hydrolase
MIITDRPALSPEEEQLPLAEYYDLPLYPPGPRELQLIDTCPIDQNLAIKAEDFVDLLEPTGYDKAEYGYCMMDDGTGYMAIYTVYPGCTPKMLGWWFRWLNVHPKGMPEGKGNLKYKIWCPPDHFDHGFINGKDSTDGIYAVESIDLGKGEERVYFFRHPFNLRDYGLTREREQALKAAGCWIDCSWVSFHSPDAPHRAYPGTYLWLTISRDCPQGGMEKRTRVWIGYGVKEGKVYFDKSTPSDMLCEQCMRKFLIHCTVEAQHLSKFLPVLYAEYSGKPDDQV